MSRGSLGVTAAALAAALLAGGGCRRQAPVAARAPEGGPPWVTAGGPMTPFVCPGIPRPPVKPAAAAGLPDDAAVAGVVVGGKARAYLLSAMTAMTGHVVNDVVGDTPVTVTYDDHSDCVRGYTADTLGRPLSVGLGGWAGKMMLKTKDGFYWQDTAEATNPHVHPPFPYKPLPLERATWKAWREAHPDTEVYTEIPPPRDPDAGRP
jgi:hypothetical protein